VSGIKVRCEVNRGPQVRLTVPDIPEVKLRAVDHIGNVLAAGDFCFVQHSAGEWVIMACPRCATVFVCKHNIVARDPLTLSPSVVGPDQREVRFPGEQILPPCMHHFWVKDGKALEVSGGWR
jgi:hypothetical protein